MEDIKGKKVSWLGEVILPFVEAGRIKRAVQARVPQMTEKEVSKNTEKNTLFFFNKSLRATDPIAKEELGNFQEVDTLLLTKDFLYVPEPKDSQAKLKDSE